MARLVEGAVGEEFSRVDGQHDSPALTLVRGAVRKGVKGHEEALEAAVEAAFGKVLDAISNGLVVNNVISADRAADILEGLEELGLVAGRHRIEERVEELAQQRLAALKPEHGLVGV